MMTWVTLLGSEVEEAGCLPRIVFLCDWPALMCCLDPGFDGQAAFAAWTRGSFESTLIASTGRGTLRALALLLSCIFAIYLSLYDISYARE
jgi:hypothetical protein